MPILADYQQFEGLHWETGTVRNYYDYRGVLAPHTGKPISEALLMGISGGAVMGYFSFAYKGYDPHVVILTRNTFDPLDRLLQRLGIVQNVVQTASARKAESNLLDTLEAGVPAIVWADSYSLPYNALPADEEMWQMMPIVVYGFDQSQDKVWIADRARVPLHVTTAELAQARSRVKKTKHRLLTLERPNPDKLVPAVQLGIWDCIKLFTEAPPKGSKNNFGFAAYQRWADLLTRPKMRLSWEKEFPAGSKMYAGLTSAFSHIMLFGKEGGAERLLYADFLDEASVLLDKVDLRQVAGGFRESAQLWDQLAESLLPDSVTPFGETRRFMLQRKKLFLEQGIEARDEILAIDGRLDQIKSEMAADFPLDQAGVVAMREDLRSSVLGIHDLEKNTIAALQDVMADR